MKKTCKDSFCNEQYFLLYIFQMKNGTLLIGIKTLALGLLIFTLMAYGLIWNALSSRGIEPGWWSLTAFNEQIWPESIFKLIGEFGPIGDFVGGILNPLFSLCAFIALFFSLSVQRKSIAQQLDQESFFTLLTNRESATASLELRSKGNIFIKGKIFAGRSVIREVIEYIDMEAARYEPRNRLKGMLPQLISNEKCLGSYHELRKRVELYSLLYKGKVFDPQDREEANALHKFRGTFKVNNLEELFGHVFRSTYQVLKFVHGCESFSANRKIDLINYLRAQMGESEFVVFGLSALTEVGEKSRTESIFFDLFEDRLEGSYDWAKTMRTFLSAPR